MAKMTDVMVDIETLGVVSGCAILSIGAVAFNEEEIGEKFYAVISIRSCLDVGLVINPETLEWWKKQPESARKILEHVKDPDIAIPLNDALNKFNNFLKKFDDEVVLWGNGSVFDNSILLYCFNVLKIKPNVKFYNHLCYRTICRSNPDIKKDDHGVKHNALDDAIGQALHFIKIMKG